MKVMNYSWLALYMFSILWNGFGLFIHFELVHDCIQVHENISAELLELNRVAARLLKEICLNCRESVSDNQKTVPKEELKVYILLDKGRVERILIHPNKSTIIVWSAVKI